MDVQLNSIITVSLILVTSLVLVFLVFLIQMLNILKRILTKVELRIDSFEITQEEIKLKILNFVEEILEKIKSYKNSFDTGKAGEIKNESKNKK